MPLRMQGTDSSKRPKGSPERVDRERVVGMYLAGPCMGWGVPVTGFGAVGANSQRLK